MLDWPTILSDISDFTKLSLSEIADKSGFDYKYLYSLKSGKSKNPKTEFLQALVQEIGINSEWLLTGEGSILRDESTSAEVQQMSNYSIEQPETAENPEAMGMVMSQLNLIQSMLEEKGQLPKEESGHCPVCGTYWKLNDKNKAKVVGYTEALLESQLDSVDIEDDDTNTAQDVG